MFHFAQYFPITDPTLIFFVVLMMILFSPIIMGRLRIPHIIGMVIAGVIVGKYGLNILVRDASFELFGQVGLYYIMFLAGLEMDMEGVKKNKKRMLIFSLLTFSIPFVLTYFTGTTILKYSSTASLLLGAIMSSNTLIAYPIVGRYGLTRHISSTLSVGSSMIALLISLIVMASIVGSFHGGGGFVFWILFVLKFIGYSATLIFFIPRLTRWFLRRYSDAVMQFTFVLGLLFISAALSAAIGLEGIFGAFLSGLILNRFIPKVSPLMNRLEFTGNALFIPYFLIGVGMLINVRLLFHGMNIIIIMLSLVVVGTLGKAIAAIIAQKLFRLSAQSGKMMIGLTTAHAAGAIAIAMVGRKLTLDGEHFFFDDTLLNSIALMILFTCIISTVITEQAARQLRLTEKDSVEVKKNDNDERILIPVKYQEYSENLFHLASLMRNPSLKRELVALNVVYDDINTKKNLMEGQRLLDRLKKTAASVDVPLTTQVRIAANIANGIKHAFKESQSSEIVMGLHFHTQNKNGFWGEFARSLYNGLNRQIIIARIKRPLNTLRRIQVAVPSRAEYEPGFYRWLERLVRLAGNLECRITFNARQDTLQLIKEFIVNRYANTRAEYEIMEHWNEIPYKAMEVKEDQMFVIVTARKGTISYKTAMEHLPDEINQYFRGKTIMIVYPDQFGSTDDSMTFAQPQHTEEKSAYDVVSKWILKKKQQ